MQLKHLLSATAAIALMGGSAFAQEAAKAPAAPADAAAPAASAPKVVAAGDIVQTAQASGQFNTFLKAAEATNLTGLLKTNKNLTVFAPTDAAFAALPAGELDKLMLPENKAQLQKLLVGHVVNAPVKTADFKGATRDAPTVAGTTVKLSGGDELMVNDAHIVQADITATNGVIQVIDKVLMTGAPAAATAAAAGAPASATVPDTPSASATSPDKLAAIDSVLQCQTPSAPMAQSPVPEKDAAVKDESATPAPSAAQAGSDAAAQEPAAPPVNEAAPAEPAAPAPDAAAPTPDVGATPPADTPAAAPAATPGADAAATVAGPSTTTATMQPVADTPENRAKYKPLSNAGKRSSAKGN